MHWRTFYQVLQSVSRSWETSGGEHGEREQGQNNGCTAGTREEREARSTNLREQRAVMRDSYQGRPATCTHTHTHCTRSRKTHTHRRHTCPRNNIPVTHAHACFVPVHIEHIKSSLLLCSLLICLSHLIFLFVLPPSFFFFLLPIKFQGSVIFYTSITGDRPTAMHLSRSPELGPTRRSVSKSLSCAINLALSRMFYLSSDCHFLFISADQLVCQGGRNVRD